MVLFLTSSPTGNLDGSYLVEGLDNRNGFVDRLRPHWKLGARCLIISAFPENEAANDEMRSFFRMAVLKSGFTISAFDLWDKRTTDFSKERLHSYDVVFLGGGHVPTQRAFFERIRLRESFAGFAGIVIGISAGSMNAAEEVYSVPEEAGEATDPDYVKFFSGLNLTRIKILPHYQMVKGYYKDGIPLYPVIVKNDSMGYEFISIEDGAYVYEHDGRSFVYGDAYLSKDGEFKRISSYGECAAL